jgi:hypothetical protein
VARLPSPVVLYFTLRLGRRQHFDRAEDGAVMQPALSMRIRASEPTRPRHALNAEREGPMELASIMVHVGADAGVQGRVEITRSLATRFEARLIGIAGQAPPWLRATSWAIQAG